MWVPILTVCRYKGKPSTLKMKCSYIVHFLLVLASGAPVFAQNSNGYYASAESAFIRARYDSSLLLYRKAKDSFNEKSHNSKLFDTEIGIIESLHRKSDYSGARQHLDKLAYRMAQGDWLNKKSDYLRLLADNNFKKGDYHQAIALYDSADHFYRYSRQFKGLAKIIVGKSLTFIKLYEIDSAMANGLIAQQIYRENELDDPELAGSIYDVLGQATWHKGQFDKAIELFKKAIAEKAKILNEDHPDIAGLFNSIGIMYKNMMQYDKALEYYGISLDRRKKFLGDDHLEVSHTYNNIGYVLYHKKDFEEAQKLHHKALKIRRAVLNEMHPRVLQSLEHIGLCYGGMEKYDKAEDYFRIVLEKRIKKFGYNNHWVGYALYNLGAVAVEEKDYKKAANYFKKASEIGSKVYGDYHPDQADNFNRLANCYLEIGKVDSARHYFHLALEKNLPGYSWNGQYDTIPNTDHYLSFREVFRSLVGLADVFSWEQTDKKFELALDYVYAGEKVINDYKKGFTKEGDRIKISSYSRLLADVGIKIHYQLFQATGNSIHLSEAFRYTELTRTSELLMTLEDSKAKRISNIPDGLLLEEKSYRNLKDSLNSQIIESLKNNKKQFANLKNSLFRINQKHENFITRLEEDYPEYSARKYGVRPAVVDELQTAISIQSNKLSLLQYHMTEEGSLFVNIITKDKHKLIALDVKDLREKITGLKEAIVKHQLESFKNLSHSLYLSVLKPAVNHLENETDLIIIPDGILAYVPFDVLLTENVKNEQFNNLPYLLKDYCISYDLSATLFFKRLSEDQREFSKGLIAYAPRFKETQERPTLIAGLVLRSNELIPLDGANEESISISKQMSGQLRDKDLATEYRFKQEAGDYGIIHLATHSIINDKDPAYSKLLFSETDDGEDDQLHAFELLNMELNAELVTLSACSTGFGKIEEGEGVMSLARAFSAAGVPSVVMSLWPASDEHTADLMERFYKNLKKGLGKNEALHKAKLSFLENADPLGAKPFHWSGFVLIGDPGPILIEDGNTLLRFLLIFMGISVALIGIRKLKLV